MDITIHTVNIYNTLDVSGISKQLSNLEKQMSIIEDALAAALAEQDAIKASIDATVTLVTEVKQLLLQDENPNELAIALLDKIAENAPALAQNIATVQDLTVEVDAVNGDPVAPVDEPAA
jgi:hypothetical protein